MSHPNQPAPSKIAEALPADLLVSEDGLNLFVLACGECQDHSPDACLRCLTAAPQTVPEVITESDVEFIEVEIDLG